MKLELNNIRKDYRGSIALDNVNLCVDDVKMLVIIGPSGGGKTTLLRVLAGLVVPTSGSMSVNGKDIIFKEKSLREYRKSVGIVFQNYNLFSHLTAIKNITMPLVKVHKMSVDYANDIAEKHLRRFGLIDHAYKKPAELSGGQKQRVAIARAISVDPDFLLLDEPTSALDPQYTTEVLDVIYELQAEGKEFVFVTHHMNFAKMAGGQAIFIDQGNILEIASPKQIIEAPTDERVRSFMKHVIKY